MFNSAKKSWISPFVAVTYGAVAITGILMLFHLKLPGVYPVHQWGGLIFVVGGTVHLLLNWRIFASYFKSRKALVGALTGSLMIILVAALVPSKTHESDHRAPVTVQSQSTTHTR